MERVKIKAGFLKTISWLDDKIIDWANGGTTYSHSGNIEKASSYFPFKFDAAITSADGTYAFIYCKLGTKGVLLKNGNELRGINRPYYCANAYEYPAALVSVDGENYLVHCPLKYNRLDFENVETGKIITKARRRKDSYTFHSRLEVSPDGNFLMSKGWLWHPLNVIEVYDIKACLQNPGLLDNSTITPEMGVEICTASFINNSQILIGSTDEVFDEEKINPDTKCLATWNMKTNEITDHVKVKAEFGNVFAIDDTYAWDLFKYPKIINFKTGEVVDEDQSIDSGSQNSSIIGSKTPQIVYNRQTKQIAIARDEAIEVLTPGFNLDKA